MKADSFVEIYKSGLSKFENKVNRIVRNTIMLHYKNILRGVARKAKNGRCYYTYIFPNYLHPPFMFMNRNRWVMHKIIACKLQHQLLEMLQDDGFNARLSGAAGGCVSINLSSKPYNKTTEKTTEKTIEKIQKAKTSNKLFCEYCGRYNNKKRELCKSCGAPLNCL